MARSMGYVGVWLGLGVVLMALGALYAQERPAEASETGKSAQSRYERQDALLRERFGALEIRRDVVYAKVGEKALKLDLFVPQGKARAGEVRPLVVWIHGGGWRGGSKESCHALFLLKRGYAVASINYRLTHEASFPAQIWDCKAAIRFLRAKAHEYGYDPGAIGVMGGSAGGHLAALMGTTNNHGDLEGKVGDFLDVSSNVQAVCDCFGPTDLTVQFFDGKEIPKELVVPMEPDEVLSTKVNQSTPKNELTELLGGQPTRTMEKARLASPLLQVSAQSSPFMVIHGDKDAVVPVYQSRVFVQKLKDEGVPVEYVEIAGGGHGGPEFLNEQQTARMTAFFDRYLRKTAAEPRGDLPRTFKTR